MTHTELHSYTIILPIAQTYNSSITLDPKDTPNPKIHIHNSQILSVQHFQDGIFLNPPNPLKYSIRLIIVIMFWFSKILLSAFWFSNIFSLCFWQTQPNITHIHSENCCKDPFPNQSLGEHITVSTALPGYFCSIYHLSSLSKPILAYHHHTYCSLIIVRSTAVVCSYLKLGQFS